MTITSNSKEYFEKLFEKRKEEKEGNSSEIQIHSENIISQIIRGNSYEWNNNKKRTRPNKILKRYASTNDTHTHTHKSTCNYIGT